MALINRKKNESVLPEVDKYYEGEKRERAGLAWLLALLSVIVVALLLVGTFLAGRWVYRQFSDSGESNVAITDDVNQPTFDGGSSNNEGQVTTNDEPQDQPAQTDTPAPTPSTPAPQTTPATGDNAPTSDLPNTGPASTALTFVAVSTAAGVAHYAITSRRAAKQ